MRSFIAACAVLCLVIPARAEVGEPDGTRGVQRHATGHFKSLRKHRVKIAHERRTYRSARKLRSDIFSGYVRRGGGTSRDCLTGETRGILDRLEAEFGRVHIVSTCVVKNIAGTNRRSYHSFGMAVDFDAPKGRKSEVVQWLHRNNNVLVMTYWDLDHIHFNTGQGKRLLLARSSHVTGKSRHARLR